MHVVWGDAREMLILFWCLSLFVEKQSLERDSGCSSFIFFEFFLSNNHWFTGTLRGLSFLLICKTMTIHWTCGASAVCLQEWWALCLKWLFHSLYFNYFAFSSRKHQTTVFLLPTDFSQGTILLWSWQSRPACQNCKGNPKFVLFEMC